MICEVVFRAAEPDISDNEIIITGETTITTSPIMLNMSKAEKLPQVYGSNWRIEIKNLENFSYTISIPYEYREETYTIPTRNLTITGSSFYISSKIYLDMKGYIKIKKIFLSDGDNENFEFIVESGNISIASLNEIYLQRSTIFYDDGELYIDYTALRNPIRLRYSSEPLILIALKDGAYLDLIDYLSEMKIDGKILIESIDGFEGIDGRLYFGGPITIKSDNIKIKTIQLPEPGERHGLGWAHEPKYWTVKIQSEDGIKAEGFGLPYWSFGLLASSIFFILFKIFNRLKIKGNREKEKVKTK